MEYEFEKTKSGFYKLKGFKKPKNNAKKKNDTSFDMGRPKF